MNALSIQDTIVLNKSIALPTNGIICAHPGRVERIAREYLNDAQLHTNYRGYQIYTGYFENQFVFVANTGIGAPAAAFLLEELVAFGARKIIRLGSNDSQFTEYQISLVKETTLPPGLVKDYNIGRTSVKINDYMDFMITLKSIKMGLKLNECKNTHVDGYYAAFRNREGSSDMESGALYLLGLYYDFQFASLLLSYPKHGAKGEYGGEEAAYDLEGQAIQLALMSLKE